MNDHDLPTALTQWIREIFQGGLVLTDEVARFMESAFGTRDIGEVLSESRDSEIDSLLELLCFPDREIQIRFESRWGHCSVSADDLTAVVTRLGGTPLRTRIFSPAGTLLAAVDMPPFALEAFVRRLNITWQPPPQLSAALEQHRPDERGMAIRVHLRNARLPWHGDQISLMELFLGRMPPDSEQFETCLAFLISILSELMPGTGGHDFLIAKKFFYFQSLCRAEDFERKRQSSNMEIMILQGARAAHGSIDEWRRNMLHIDLICQALFGRTQFFQQPGEHCVDVEDADPARQIQDVLRLLS
jgi:hypothetical protein